jgi:hypothetical protein
MNRIFLILLLAFVSSNAMAEWLKVADSELGSYYVNPSSIHWKGNRVKMWRMTDLLTARNDAMGNAYISYLELNEYDCSEDQFRPIAFQNYSEHMAEGHMVSFNSDVDKWQPIPPGSVAEIFIKVACGKK